MRDTAEADVAFSEELPVRLRIQDREPHVASLTVRVAVEPGPSPVLSVLLTDENDAFFLYSLRVRDSDFHALKAEQSLLVDFQTFPGMLAALLGECRPGGKYSLHLAAGVEGTLAVVEANGFRELTHVSLQFRRGNDEAVKGYLAGRLGALKGNLASAQERLRAQDEDLRRHRQEREQLTAQLRAITEEKQQVERAAQLRADSAIAELREQHGRELRENGLTSQRERVEAETRLQEALRAAEARALRAEAARDELTTTRDQLSASLASTERQLDTAQASLNDAETSLAERRNTGQANERARFELEKKVAELTVQCQSYAEQLSAKEKLLASATEMKQAGDSQKETVEGSLAVLRQTLAQTDEKYALATKEIDRGNQIISTLQAQVKGLKGKLRVKAAALVSQERGVQDLERSAAEERRRAEERARELESARTAEAELRAQADESVSKLRDAQELLSSNKQVIDFLNKQLTDRELAYGLGSAPPAYGLGSAPPAATTAPVVGGGLMSWAAPTAGATPGRRVLSEGYLAALHGDRVRTTALDTAIAGLPTTPLPGRAPPSDALERSAIPTPKDVSGNPGRSLDAFLPTTVAPPLFTAATPPRGPIHYVRPEAAEAK